LILDQAAAVTTSQERGSLLDEVQAGLRRVLAWVKEGGLVRVARHELFIPSLVAILGLSLMFWPIMRQVFRMWRDDDNYSHIILVPFLIGWQLHRRRDMFDPKARKTAPMVLLLLIPLAFFQFIAFVGDWWALQSVCLVAAIFGMVWALFGGNWAWRALFPILFIFFMLPVASSYLDANTNELQIASTTVAEKLLSLAGFTPMRLDPTSIQLNSYALNIAVPCSGLKLLVAVTCFTCHFILFARSTFNFNFMMLLIIIPLCLLMNGLRIAMIGVVGEQFGAPAGAAFHDWSGYIMLLLCFWVIFKAARLLGWKE
jgi:exosortase